MTAKPPSPIDLRRIDPAKNMRRFYMIAIQPTLFGGISVIRNWGRIGSNGQTKIDNYDDLANAETAIARLAEVKIKRGYVDSCGARAYLDAHSSNTVKSLNSSLSGPSHG